MSRDAKVGLVIITCFGVLLGTILFHRFQSATDASTNPGDDSGSGSSDQGALLTENSSTDSSSPGSFAGQAPTAVEAVSTGPVDAPFGDTNLNSPPDSTFTNTQRTPPPGSSARQPSEPPQSSASGAHITLTDPDASRQPAAVVEQPGTSSSSGANSSPGRQPSIDMPDHRGEITRRTTRSLDTPNSRRETPDDQSENSGRTAEVRPLDSAESDRNRAIDPNESPESEPETTTEPASSGAGSPLDRIPAERTPSVVAPEERFNPDPSDLEIQTASGKQRTATQESSNPKLPRYGETAQAITETVPHRGTRGGEDKISDRPVSPPSKGNEASPKSIRESSPKSGDPKIDRSAGETTYVVQEGDSYWTISAKQYGTAKHFRALEEYNAARSARAGSSPSKQVLRLGTTIYLPPVSVFKPKAPNTNPVTDSDNRAGESPFLAGRSHSTTKTANGSTVRSVPDSPRELGTYRVQDGDTLSTIAQRELGTSKRWDEILRLNQDKVPDPNRLKVGTDLKLPAARPGERIADRPHPGR